MNAAKFRKTLQLQLDLQEGGPLRPILVCLNGDNGWLMSFPRPLHERATSGKAYYHVIFEPWLRDPITLLSPSLLHVSLTEEPAFSDSGAIEAIVDEIETLSRQLPLADEITNNVEIIEDGVKGLKGYSPPLGDNVNHTNTTADNVEILTDNQTSLEENDSNIDAIFLGFHYEDHTNKASLMLFNPRIPVFATPQAAAIVDSWGHFETVRVTGDLYAGAKTWRSPDLHPGGTLPSWLAILRLRGHIELHSCTSIVWTHTVENNEIHEAIIITPHGIHLDDGPFQAFLDAKPQTKKLAMMCGLKESYSYGILQNFGVKGGLAVYRRMGGARYWVKSHHQTYAYGGLISKVTCAYDVQQTLDWGLEEERKASWEEEGPADAWDNGSYITYNEGARYFRAMARFHDEEDAHHAVELLNGTPIPSSKGNKMWVQQVHVGKLRVPGAIYAAVRAEVEVEKQAWDRYLHFDEFPPVDRLMSLKLESRDRKSVEVALEKLDDILTGEIASHDGKPIWIESPGISLEEKERKLNEIGKRLGVIIWRNRICVRLQVCGPPEKRREAIELLAMVGSVAKAARDERATLLRAIW
ncbi:uncharacterized protein DNG_04379 [Cephalotrichum gorgonifer]|uniref:Uncharacterized protein n=1 Tax=Cephalotrichum gorgonifer TaxID=2041049 RepID=A0AAE8MVZ0_9PEZI|nr:uncharacterized protein DNG_04379 [Cephalotrichum gorgonifer]